MYEMMTIIRPELDDEAIQTTINRIESLVNRYGGTVQNVTMWGRRKLAYPLSSARQGGYRAREGVYVIFNLDMPAQAANALARDLRLMEDILRFLTINRDEGAARAATPEAETSEELASEEIPGEEEAVEDTEATEFADSDVETPESPAMPA
jgi:small subunit ribosomal protein S6